MPRFREGLAIKYLCIIMKPIYFCHFQIFKPLKIKGVIEFRVIYGFEKSFYTKNFKVDTILTKIILGWVSCDLNKRFNILGPNGPHY